MAGLSLQLKPPGRLRSSFGCLPSGTTPTRPAHCAIRGKERLVLTSNAHLTKLRHRFVPESGISSRRRGAFGLGFGGGPVVAVSAGAGGNGDGEGETNDSDAVPDEAGDRIEPRDANRSFPAGLIVHRRDPRNLFLYAAGFCAIGLMRDVLLREFAGRGINFGRMGLYIAECVAIGLGKLTNVLAEPIAFLISVVSWAIMAATDIYTLIVDAAPVNSLFNSLILAVAVLSIGDAAACGVRGSRSRLVGVATVIAFAAVLEVISPETVLVCLTALTAFAKLIQKADPVTVCLPATVTLVAISEPVLRVAAFGVFLAVSVHANWRAASQQLATDSTESEVRERDARTGTRPSLVLSLVSASICIGWAARMLHLRSVKWLLLRSS